MKVFLGMSGGVDSSVAATLLQKDSYDVTGCYMKNWSRDLPGMKCPWAEDLADAKRVATMLDIEFKVFDFETQYRQKVVDYMLAEYQKGNTPNPDIMCNEQIKFKLFFDTALEQGADLIATGHYARTDGQNLLRAADDNKDQTYFLYRISDQALAKTIFPIGGMQKSDVKKLAAKLKLPVAHKPESMGVCFVGEAGIREFISEFIETKPGEIRELETGQILGSHDGAIFYTLGQRHGLYLTTGLPYYVVKKDMKQNIIYVSRDLNNSHLWSKQAKLTDVFIRAGQTVPKNLRVRIRHRAPLAPATFNAKTQTVTFTELQKSLTPGQSIVFYAGKNHEICLGGGIISQ
ncbi:tRNA 2-thiouridine(34) synthase MnmA [Candidatus Saccharibacteria bacterium]|nr:tRNA 2-thiouridine(34) synthase MnmA [Candidatus Saccharibacteria bacterium]